MILYCTVGQLEASGDQLKVSFPGLTSVRITLGSTSEQASVKQKLILLYWINNFWSSP